MKEKIYFIKLNESWAQIACEDSVRYELSDYFTFEVENAKWKIRNSGGWWDGKVRLLKGDMTIYFGLKDEVKKFCSERGYEFVTDVDEDQKIDPKWLMDLVKSWKPTRFNADMERIPLHPHQEQMEAIYAALVKKKIIIESATAAGKSFIVCALNRILSENKMLVVVPRVALANQLLDNYDEYFQDWNPDIDLLYSGQRLTGADIVIGTWQSLAKKAKPFFEDFNTVVYDEVHEAESKSACKILESCVNAEYKVGLTGTLKDAKTHKLTLQGLFGKSYKFSTAKDNMDQGKSAKLKLLVYKMNYQDKLKGDHKSGAAKYKAELEYIWYNQDRNNIIYDTAKKLKGTSLVLFKNTDHGDHLYREYTEKYGKEDVFLIHGKINTELREKIKKYVLNNPNKKIVIFASLGTFSTGINIPNIKAAILAGPIKDKIKLLQSIGRGLRLKNDGSGFLFIDIVDIIPNGGILSKHGKSRINRYIQEQFTYSVESFKL